MKQRCDASPGPIVPGESIVRAIYSPDLFNTETGEITVAAVKLDELMSKGGIIDKCGDSSGVSVFRIDHDGGMAQLTSSALDIASRPKKDGSAREPVGYAKLIVDDVVNIYEGPFDILDDGKIGLSCHAVIRSPAGRTAASLRGARDRLIQLMNKNIVRF